MRRMITCPGCGRETEIMGGGKFFCHTCRKLHDVPPMKTRVELRGEAAEPPPAAPPARRPTFWDEVQKGIGQKGAGAPVPPDREALEAMGIDPDAPTEGSHEDVLRARAEQHEKDMRAAVARCGSEKLAQADPNYRRAKYQLGLIQGALGEGPAAVPEPEAEAEEPSEEAPEAPTEEEPAGGGADALADIEGAVEGDAQAPQAAPPEGPPIVTVADIKEETGALIKDIITAAEAAGVAVTRGSDTVTQADKSRITTILRGAASEGDRPPGTR